MTDDLSAAKNGAVIRFLRDIADRIEAGELAADAAAIVLSEGDIHRPGGIGYKDGPVWVNARQSLYYHVGDSDPSPEDRAEWRAEQARQQQADQDVYDRTHPWRCACNQRFKTHRGWKTHRGAARRRASRDPDTATIIYGGPPPRNHETVIEIDTPDPEPPIQLFPDVS